MPVAAVLIPVFVLVALAIGLEDRVAGVDAEIDPVLGVDHDVALGQAAAASLT